MEEIILYENYSSDENELGSKEAQKFLQKNAMDFIQGETMGDGMKFR